MKKIVWINGELAGEYLTLTADTGIPQVWFVQPEGDVGFTDWYNCKILADGVSGAY